MASDVCTWIAPDGTQTAFDGTANIVLAVGPAARFMPPVTITTEDTPNNGGARIKNVKLGPRQVTLSLEITAATGAEVRTTLRSLLAQLDPTRGDGRIRFETIAGDTRDLICRYAGGLEGDDSTSTPDQSSVLVSPQFVAADPYWTDPSDTVQTWTTATGQSFFPILPLRLSSSQVFASATVTNVGDVDTPIVWTINGPASNVVLTHLTSGRRLVWNGTLGLGESLTIDGRPSALSATPMSVVRQDGVNMFKYLALDGHDFWPLSIGTQTIQIEAAGTDENSSVSASWRARYLGV